jgi:hypothetical protein
VSVCLSRVSHDDGVCVICVWQKMKKKKKKALWPRAILQYMMNEVSIIIVARVYILIHHTAIVCMTIHTHMMCVAASKWWNLLKKRFLKPRRNEFSFGGRSE